ncbi:MAG: serine hydrolase domain-containing protein [Gemmatimonadales bacterium]
MPGIIARARVAAVAIAIIDDGQLTWSKVYGRQGPDTPATARTLFNTASLGKTMTAETILRLVAKGAISLDEPLSSYWVDPDIADDPRHRLLTPRIVLTHQTGFPNWRRLNKGGRLAFLHDPGTQYGYSGEGLVYLFRFVEQKLGRSYEDLVQEEVLDPIGLTETALSGRDWMAGHVAVPMDEYGEFREPEVNEAGGGNPAGDVFLTVTDFAKFMIGVMDGDGLSEELAADRLRLQSDATTDPQWACAGTGNAACPDSIGYGLGWMRLVGKRTVMYHGGNDWGEHALAYFYPDTHDGLVIFVNGGNGVFAALDVTELIDEHQPITPFFREALKGAATLRIVTTTTGSTTPADLTFVIDNYHPVKIGATDTVMVQRQAPGERKVEIRGLPTGCQLEGPNPRSIEAAPGAVTDFAFQIRC